MKAFRILAVTLAIAGSTSCMGGIEARMKVEAARAKSVADRCAQLTQSKTSIASPGGVFGAGTVDFRAELSTQLKGLLGGLGTLKENLKKFGASAELDAVARVRYELKALKNDITEPEKVSEDALNATAAVAKKETKRVAKQGAAKLDEVVESLSGRLDVVLKDFDTASTAATEISKCVANLKLDASLELRAQLEIAESFVGKMTTCGAGQVATFINATTALPDHVRDLENALADVRGTIDALKQSTDTTLTAIGARSELAIIEITALVRAQSRWLTEATAIAALIEKARTDKADYARELLTAMGERILVRQAGGYAKAAFRLARITMRQVDRQLASLSNAGYGLGSIPVTFASGYIDAAVERTGESVGRMTRKLGSGANAVLYEACSELEESNDSDMAILGMAPFYAGFIRGFDAVRAQEETDGRTASLDQSWWRDQLRAGPLANHTETRGPFDSVLADAPPPPPPPKVSLEGELTSAEIDLLADWTALYAIERRTAWGPPPPPVDRRQSRSAYVQTLLAYPELFRKTGGEQSGTTNAPTQAPTTTTNNQTSTNETTNNTSTTTGPTTVGPTTTYLDQRLMYVYLGEAPSVGGTGAGGKIDEHNVTVDVSALKTSMEELSTAHKHLINELQRRETHWLATQFVASICQSIGGSRISRSTGVWCAPRQSEDSVSTLALETPSFPNGEWDRPTAKRKGFYETVKDVCKKPPSDNPSLSKACTQAKGWSSHWELGKADSDSFALIVQATQTLARQIRSHANQMLGGEESNNVRIVVTGMASALGFTCDQLRFRLLAASTSGKPRALHRCDAKKGYGAKGVDLCFEATPTDPALALRSGDHRWECHVEHDEVEPDDDATATKNVPPTDNANELLAVLRGWFIRKTLEKEMEGSSFIGNLLFEIDPPPALGTNCKFGDEGCSKYKVAEVQVRVWAPRAEGKML